MNCIDHTAPGFNLLSGYYCQVAGDILFYGKAYGNDAHVIVHDRDGYVEFTQKNALPYQSVERIIDGMAEEAIADNGRVWYTKDLD